MLISQIQVSPMAFDAVIDDGKVVFSTDVSALICILSFLRLVTNFGLPSFRFIRLSVVT